MHLGQWQPERGAAGVLWCTLQLTGRMVRGQDEVPRTGGMRIVNVEQAPLALRAGPWDPITLPVSPSPGVGAGMCLEV